VYRKLETAKTMTNQALSTLKLRFGVEDPPPIWSQKMPKWLFGAKTSKSHYIFMSDYKKHEIMFFTLMKIWLKLLLAPTKIKIFLSDIFHKVKNNQT